METVAPRTHRLAVMAMLLAVSAIGSYVKLGPYTIAFDSAGGFVAALLLGPGPGALVCGIGHLVVAVLTGFPLTPVFHLEVALSMAMVGALGGLAARRWGLLAGAVTMIVANGLVSPALMSLLPNPMGTGLFAALVVPLTLAASANATVALLAAQALRRASARL